MKRVWLLVGLVLSVPSFGENYYKVCCTHGAAVKALMSTIQHDDRASQFDVRIVGLRSFTGGGSGPTGGNLRGEGVCAWEDRPVFNDGRKFEIQGAWLAQLSAIRRYISMIPGRGIEEHLVFFNDFYTGNFVTPMVAGLPPVRFCVEAKSSPLGPDILAVRPNAKWFFSIPSPWGGRD